MKNIVLASKSIDRRLLFRSAKFPFEVLITIVDEGKFKAQISNPIELAKNLAQEKALHAKESLNNELIENCMEDMDIAFSNSLIALEKFFFLNSIIPIR